MVCAGLFTGERIHLEHQYEDDRVNYRLSFRRSDLMGFGKCIGFLPCPFGETINEHTVPWCFLVACLA